MRENEYLLVPDSELETSQRNSMTSEEVVLALDAFLKDLNPEFALMLSGEWGAGKSHLIKSYLESKKHKKTLTVSLFGLGSLTQIEDAVIAEMSHHLSELGGGSFSRLLGSVATFASEDKAIGGLTGAAAAIGGPMARSKLLNRMNKGWLLIFEDLERSSSKPSEVLGFINRFVENKWCHVILVANEDEFEKKDAEYKSQKEKLVGVTLKLSLPSSDIANIGCKHLFSLKGPERNAAADTIIHFCRQTEVSNIRTIQFACIQLDRLFSVVKLQNPEKDISPVVRVFLMMGLVLAVGARKWNFSPDVLFMLASNQREFLSLIFQNSVSIHQEENGESLKEEDKKLIEFEKLLLKKVPLYS